MKLFIKHSVFKFVVTVLAASLSQKRCEEVGLNKTPNENYKAHDGRRISYIQPMFVWHLTELDTKSGFLSF